MSSVKCPQCGLINWANAQTCKRCQAVLQSGFAQPAYTPAPTQPPPQQTYSYQQTAHSYEQPASGYQQSGFNYQQPENYNPYPSYADYWSLQRGSGSRSGMELASRGSRLAASLIDDVCVIVPLMLGLALFVAGAQTSSGADDGGVAIIFLLLMILVLLAVAIVQLCLLSTHGQTIGKKVLNIKIVKADTGEHGGFTHNALLRSILPGFIGGFPYIGPLFHLVDTLFIFRADQRCIHDLIAGTCVVKK